MTWHMLASHGIACRGPEPSTVDIHLDPAALTAWSDANLDGYWRPWLTRGSSMSRPHGWFALTPYAAVWLVTGVSRLHHTITTGEIVAKEDAARYALATFPPRWHRLITDVLRIRRADLAGSSPGQAFVATVAEHLPSTSHPRPEYRTPTARRRDLLAFGHMAIDDAHRLYRDRRATDTPR